MNNPTTTTATSLTPERVNYVLALAGADDVPDNAVLLALTPDEMSEFVRGLGRICADDLIRQFFQQLLSGLPCDTPLAGDERDVHERVVLQLARAFNANWPYFDTGKKRRAK